MKRVLITIVAGMIMLMLEGCYNIKESPKLPAYRDAARWDTFRAKWDAKTAMFRDGRIHIGMSQAELVNLWGIEDASSSRSVYLDMVIDTWTYTKRSPGSRSYECERCYFTFINDKLESWHE